MSFAPGDSVHVALFGRGTVREARNGGRYLVEVKGNAMVVAEAQLTAAAAPPPRRAAIPRGGHDAPAPRASAASIDLHGRTVAEAEADVDTFLNDALMAGHAEVRIIHGIGGGRVKAAVHARLRRVSAVRGFRVDPSNAGVTIVAL